MRIKRLELTGFKSCMDRTVLDFPDGITGIVGPNGCGKSNIVDALRWVLGEQSAKHLRGRAMEDVIFAGNQRLGALGAAEVTVVLDNEEPVVDTGEGESEDNDFVAAVRSAPELQVTRRLYRSGESEYLINKRLCRLRDITELFLGTGVGTKAYSIIEQGRVGQIVNAKPEELRLFIEEAAGTTLYRSRKLAAERKIERTRDNLLRVNDVVRELERQANSLKRQARGAIRYQELKAEEEALDRGLSAHRVRALDERKKALEGELDEVRGREAARRRQIETDDVERNETRAKLEESEDRSERMRRAVYEAKGRLGELEQERRYLESRGEELERLIVELRDEQTALEGQRSRHAEERTREEGARAAAKRELQEAIAERASLERELGELESAYMEQSSRREEVKAEIIEGLAAVAALKNERGNLARQQKLSEEKLERLGDESDSLSTVARRLVSEVEAGRASLDAVVESTEKTKGGKSSAADVLDRALARQAEAQREAESLTAKATRLGSRLQSLKELQETFVGYGDGVKAFMSNGGREVSGASAVIADVIEIDEGYETAVAAVLQDRLQYVVVPDAAACMTAASYMRETRTGRASFIPREPRRSGEPEDMPPGFSPLAQHLRVRDGYETVVTPLLEGVVVADSLEQASNQWRLNGYTATFVTREGEVVESSGVTTGGSGRPVEESLLTRNSELRALSTSLTAAEGSLSSAVEELADTRTEAERAGDCLAGVDARLHELTIERVAVEGDLELRRQNLVRTEERVLAVESELAMVGGEASEAQTRVREIGAEIEERERVSAALDRQSAELGAQIKEIDDRRRSRASVLEAVRVREAELRQKQEACGLRLRSLQTVIQDLDASTTSVQQRVERYRLEAARGAARLADAALNPEQVEREVASLERESATTDDARLRLRGELDAIERRAAETRKGLDELRGEVGRVELRVKECELERASVTDAVRERLGLAVEELLTATGADDEFAVGEAEEGLEAARRKIRRLGTVNMGAVIELEEISGRLTGLVSQRDDLEKSVEDLRGSIARLNRLSKKRFRETFEAANEIFQETFPKLFRGGKASLALSDENNLLETGVEIFVQPPGKKLGNLNLLSGGEKALTAISLIFSLFMYKPSPFCVLDEVDAPLDEANIGRFTRMVQDMSARSQFLLITHNKRTMESCRTLYGVTMPEPGISKIVSVDLTAR